MKTVSGTDGVLSPGAPLTIVRGAAAEGMKSWLLPPVSGRHPEPHRGSDPLAGVVLELIAFLLADISRESLGLVGLVAGTTLGSLETDRAFDRSRRDSGGRYASPAAFSRTLPSTIPAEVALTFGLTGPMLVVSAGADSAALALRRAGAWMRQQNMDLCLAGGFDWTGPSGEVPESVRAAFFLLAREGPGVGRLRLAVDSSLEAPCAEDRSLIRLIEGIKGGGEFVAGAGGRVEIADA